MFCNSRFYLAILETHDDEFPAFAVRENRVSEIFQLGDAEFRPEIDQCKASHFQGSMANLGRKSAGVPEFVEH